MNGFGLFLFLLCFALGGWLHHRQNQQHREFEEFCAEARLAGMVKAINEAGDEVARGVFAARGRWN